MDDRELDEALTEMRSNSVSIVEAIKFVRAEQGVDLGEAKKFVSHHASYRDIHEATEPLHRQLEAWADAGLFDDDAPAKS